MYLAVSFDQEKSLQEQQTIFKVLMNIKVPQEFNFIKALVTRKQRFLKKFFVCVSHNENRESPQRAQPEWEKSSLLFIEAVHQ